MRVCSSGRARVYSGVRAVRMRARMMHALFTIII